MMDLKVSCGTSSESEGSVPEPVNDVYYVSCFFPFKRSTNTNSPVLKLTNIQKLKLVQKILTFIKYVLSFEEDILYEQAKMWLYITEIIDFDQRNKIKEELESHCLTPITWKSHSEIEVIVDPDQRIVKKKG